MKTVSLIALVCIALLAPGIVRGGTVCWTGASSTNWTTAGNWTNTLGETGAPSSGDDVVIDGAPFTRHPTLGLNGGSVTIASLSIGATSASTLTLERGDLDARRLIVTAHASIGPTGVLTHAANTTGETHRLYLSVGGNLTVESGGQIHADTRGYSGVNGPGQAGQKLGAASYGGRGGPAVINGVTLDTGGGPTYGAYLTPTNLGSATRGDQDSKGGGALRLTVSGTTTVHGIISANGSAGGYGGGGAGGSVFLTTGWLTGNGQVRADGAKGGTTASGGGGGRVAVYLTASDDFGSVTNRAPGGDKSGGLPGGAGTVYLQGLSQGAGNGTLIIDNNSWDTTRATEIPTGQSWLVSNLVVRKGGKLEVIAGSTLYLGTNVVSPGPFTNTGVSLRGGNLRLTENRLAVSNWELFVNGAHVVTGDITVAAGGNIGHFAHPTAEVYRVNLTVDGNLTIDPGGSINVNERGFPGLRGPGQGPRKTGGAGYGGMGGSPTGGLAYGSVLAPVRIGSGTSGDSEALAGGAVQFTVTGTTTVNGAISANGGICRYGGGASGGSVFLTTANLAGSGDIRAQGGRLSSTVGGDGGGGRLAIVLTAGTSFAGVTNSAFGGSAGATADKRGAAGTVYLQSPAIPGGRLILDNGTNTASSLTPLPPQVEAEPDNLSATAVLVTNRAVLAITASTAVRSITVIGTNEKLNLGSEGTRLTLRGLTVNGITYTQGGRYATNDWNGLPAPSNVSGAGDIWLATPGGTLIVVQ
jgi:hypothetical protein